MKLHATLFPYLLLVSFSTGQMSDLSAEKIKAINASPYSGVAVALAGPHDTNHHSGEEFDSAVSFIMKNAEKHVWPWLYLNRIVGSAEDGLALFETAANKPGFRTIKGLDIGNDAGALEDFYTLYRISLATARRLGSPGIVVDHEPYNNYRGQNVAYVSRKQEKSKDAVVEGLKSIGAKLADITEAEYPDAIVLLLSTGLVTSDQSGWYRFSTISYIVTGMLERARETQAMFKLVSGGENSLGYCYLSLKDMQETIDQREMKFERFLSAYPNLELGGTIAPWDDGAARTDWMLKNMCGRAPMMNAVDFVPLFRELFRHYRYVWVYAAKAAPYNPYDASTVSGYNNALRDALQ